MSHTAASSASIPRRRGWHTLKPLPGSVSTCALACNRGEDAPVDPPTRTRMSTRRQNSPIHLLQISPVSKVAPIKRARGASPLKIRAVYPMEWITACTVATRATHRWKLLYVPKSQPVSHRRTLFRMPKSQMRGKLANEIMPVRSETWRRICLVTDAKLRFTPC